MRTVATLQAEAQRLAHVMNSPVVLTDHLVEAVQTLTEWDISKFIQSPHKRKTNPAIASSSPTAGDPDEVVPEAQLKWIERGLGLDATGFPRISLLCSEFGRQEAGEDGDISPASSSPTSLSQQKLAPAVPKSADRVAQLERQVRDLGANSKKRTKQLP